MGSNPIPGTAPFAPHRGETAIELPRGKTTDYGDLVREVRWLVKRRHFTFTHHLGAEVDATPAERVPGTTAVPPPPGKKAELIMDLHADKKITRTVQAGDEFGNPTVFPGTYTYVGDNPGLLTVVDHGDGSAELIAVGGPGNLGPVTVTFTAAPTVGDPVVRVETVNVIAGGAETFTFVDSAESEVTPDA